MSAMSHLIAFSPDAEHLGHVDYGRGFGFRLTAISDRCGALCLEGCQ